MSLRQRQFEVFKSQDIQSGRFDVTFLIEERVRKLDFKKFVFANLTRVSATSCA